VETRADGVAELAMLLSRRLSVDVAALMRGELRPKGAATQLAYKHAAHVDQAQLAAATYLASSLAQAVSASMSQPYVPLPQSLEVLQAEVRAADQHGVLGFDAMLAVCWNHGIPVIPLPNLPVGVRKMDGAALQVANRPAIVLAKKRSSRAWLSFILGHEMGHIAQGHLRPGASIVDISLKDSSEYVSETVGDRQEQEADEYALEVLGGAQVAAAIRSWPAHASPVELAVLAREGGRALGIEPGHLVLRAAFETKRWADAASALNYLSEDMNPQEVLAARLRTHLSLELVAEDLQDLIASITGLADANTAG